MPTPSLPPLRIVSWNVSRRDEAWRLLAADRSLDLALLQEAKPPPPDVTCDVVPPRDSECRWRMGGNVQSFRTAIARLSDRVVVRGRRTVELGAATLEDVPVSRHGSIAVADVELGGETITLVSAYAAWEDVRHVPPRRQPAIAADASAHRILSDVSLLITSREHKMIVAGDFNVLHGYGEGGNTYWGQRYQTVFERAEALGLRFVGPRAPHGRQAEPRPEELPEGSLDVPTYHTTYQTPATAARQLDFVFASEAIADRVSVHAMNDLSEWGPSDHCRVRIEVTPP